MKKLEEKNSTINDLSKQLSHHELSFKEIKNELKQVILILFRHQCPKIAENQICFNKTKIRQSELDQIYNSAMQDILEIQSICAFNPDEPECNRYSSLRMLFIWT